MRALIIEDDYEVAATVALAFLVEEVTAQIAQTGTEGLEFARSNDYNIIILDVMLPDMRG